MTPTLLKTKSDRDPPLRLAALAAGLAYLLTPTPFAEFYAYPKLVIPEHIGETAQNIASHPALFAFCISAYIGSYVCDVIIACALYYLLKPVSPALSRLAAWFQLVYTAVGLSATLHLVTALQLATSPDDIALFGDGAFHAQLRLLLMVFRSMWATSLVFFGIHLLLVGHLIYRSNYIPKYVGMSVILAGFGYIAQIVNAYLFPEPDLGYVAVLLLGELVFAGWLLMRGWKIAEPPTQ